MRFLIPLALLALQQAPAPNPLEKGFEALTPDLLKKHLSTLASDEYEGRCAGFPGNDKAAIYLAARMKEAGLKPVGAPDVGGKPSYFQPFLFDDARKLARNCVGLLEGSDPVLKDEVVVIGAHFDHVGRRGQHRAGQLGRAEKDDEIWNGADDNGSGTTTLLGILHAYAVSGARPKRSILFIWFTAEEWGLLGSKWYVAHPILPLEKTVAMINLDMTGRSDDENLARCYGLSTAKDRYFHAIVERAMKTSEGFRLEMDEEYGPNTDHAPFADRGIPICGFGEKGPSPDYHKVGDHADKINCAYMVKIARAAAAALHEIADAPVRPAWNEESRKKKKKGGAKDEGKPRLGAFLNAPADDELEAAGLKGQGGLKVIEVIADSAAERAAMAPGDIIHSVNGVALDADYPRETLTEFLDKVEPGRDYPVGVWRDGKRIELKVSWPAPEKKP